MDQERPDRCEPTPAKDLTAYIDVERGGKNPFKGIDAENFAEKLGEAEADANTSQERRAAMDRKYFEKNGRASLFPAHSMDHQLICSLGALVDIKNFKQELAQFEKNDDVDLFEKWLDRYQEMEERMADLYRIDIIRRAGYANNDSKLLENAREKFNDLADELIATIEQYEKDNHGFIGREEGLADKIAQLKENIEGRKDDFYDDICQEYSELMFIEYDKFRKRILEQVAERIKQAGIVK